MRFLTIITACAGTAASMALAPRADEEPSTGPSVTISSAVTHSGNGCPQDTQVDSYNGGRSFRLHAFSAKAPGVDTTQNCALHFTVAGQPGRQVSVKHASLRAYAQVPLGTTINFWFTNFWSEDAGDTSTIQSTWSNEEGSVSGTVILELDVPADRRAWSQCGKSGILNPNFRAAIADEGFFGTKGNTVTTETLTYEWRDC
jgi:hypothetical protein